MQAVTIKFTFLDVKDRLRRPAVGGLNGRCKSSGFLDTKRAKRYNGHKIEKKNGKHNDSRVKHNSDNNDHNHFNKHDLDGNNDHKSQKVLQS